MAEHDFQYGESLHKVSIETPNGVVEIAAASYAGIPFFVEETEHSGGRIVVTTSLPFSDNHVNFDLGKKVRPITCKVYVLGVDCESKREILEEALNKEGVFEFIHPNYGRFNARCVDFGFNHKKDELEYITGEITVVPEQDPKKQARSVEDLRGTVIAKADASLDSSKSSFAENFSIMSSAKSVVDAVAHATTDMLDMIESARSSMRDVSAFVQTISQIRENVQLIMATPADFAARIQNLLTLTSETLEVDGSNEYVNESLVVMSSVMEKKPTTSSPIVDEQIAALDRLVLMTSASMAVSSVMNSKFASADEAHEMQSALTAVFEDAANYVESVDDYATLLDLQATALKYLREEMMKLAVIVVLPMNGTRDILSVCFDCYGSLDRVDEILDRNGVGDPLVMARENLKVLSK